MRKIIPLSLLVTLLFAYGCKEDKPEFSEVPVIELVSYTPNEVVEFVDSISFTISYEDGDGDLGQDYTQGENLFLVDERIPLTYGYRIKELVPGGESVPIKGTVSFSLDNTIITGQGNEETVTYSIYVVDRAGNQSNTVSTQAITVRK